MIVGLDRFRDFFRDYGEHYVLIGGVAAMQWLEEAGLHVRATKDFDLVLLVENLDDRFLNHFWQFVKEGGYSNLQKSTSSRIYYRFTAPQENDFPAMLEIFSRAPDGLELWDDQNIVPVPAEDDASSLSAILMDDEYYALVKENRQSVNNLPLLSPQSLILLKAKAWLDINARMQGGHHVDDRHLKKHRTDIFKLALLLTRQDTITIPQTVHQDLQSFLENFPPESPEWGSIRQASGLANQMPAPADLLNIIAQNFRPE